MSSRQKATSIFLFFCPSPQIFRYSAVWIHTVSCLYAIAAAAAVVFPNRVYAYHHNTACRFYRIHGLHIGIASILCLLQFVCYISFFFYIHIENFRQYIYRIVFSFIQLNWAATRSQHHMLTCAPNARSPHSANRCTTETHQNTSGSLLDLSHVFHTITNYMCPVCCFIFFALLISLYPKHFGCCSFSFHLYLSLFRAFSLIFSPFRNRCLSFSHHRQNSAIAQRTSIFVIFLHWNIKQKNSTFISEIIAFAYWKSNCAIENVDWKITLNPLDAVCISALCCAWCTYA